MIERHRGIKGFLDFNGTSLSHFQIYQIDILKSREMEKLLQWLGKFFLLK
jgi:hypothetical protein